MVKKDSEGKWQFRGNKVILNSFDQTPIDTVKVQEIVTVSNNPLLRKFHITDYNGNSLNIFNLKLNSDSKLNLVPGPDNFATVEIANVYTITVGYILQNKPITITYQVNNPEANIFILKVYNPDINYEIFVDKALWFKGNKLVLTDTLANREVIRRVFRKKTK